MSFAKALIDSDILSFYIKQYPKVVSEAQNYLRQHQIFTFSTITRFEILLNRITGLQVLNWNK